MRLHINVDHVATVRNARGTAYPDPIEAARECLFAGADGITAHLREDRRHIRDADVYALRKIVSSVFNLEMAATDEMVRIACDVRPDVVTLVPERRQERTTEGGLDVIGGGDTLAKHVFLLRQANIKVSLFIAPDAQQVEKASQLGAHQIELHTGEYAHGAHGAEAAELHKLRSAATHGRMVGLDIAAGHGLTRQNVGEIARIPEVVEVNIGHAVIADALFLSLRGAVAAMRESIVRGRGARA